MPRAKRGGFQKGSWWGAGATPLHDRAPCKSRLAGGGFPKKYNSENEIFSSMDSSLEIEPFYLVSRPHSKIVSGFPLDALSVQIESGKYFQDLEQNLAVDKKTIEVGFSQFFKGNKYCLLQKNL